MSMLLRRYHADVATGVDTTPLATEEADLVEDAPVETVEVEEVVVEKPKRRTTSRANANE